MLERINIFYDEITPLGTREYRWDTSATISYTYDSRGNIATVTFPWTAPEQDPTPTPTPTPDPTPTPTPDPGGGGHNWGDPEIGGTDPIDPILPTPTPDAGLDSGGDSGSWWKEFFGW